MLKKFFTMILVTHLFFSSFTFSNAQTFQDSNIDMKNEYLDDISNLSVNEKATAICQAYIKSLRAYARGENYSLSAFSSRGNTTNALQYRKSEAEYRRALTEEFGMKITSDDINLTLLKENIGNTYANIEIFEKYSYTLATEPNERFYRNRVYYFTLHKNEDSWNIDNVRTNDPWEEDNNFNYKPIDVKETIASIKNEIKSAQNAKLEPENSLNETNANRLYRWTYYPDVAVSYAAEYFDGVNPLFGEASADCQNFVSQCVWAGLRGSYHTATSTRTYPAVISDIVGKNSKNVWARNDSSNAYSAAYFNYAWDNAAGFAKLIETSSATAYGPLGTTYYGSLNQAQKGAVITVNWDGRATDASVLQHAMFVTKVKSSATVGAINRSDLYIAAHNSPTQSAYQPLLEYSSRPEANYSTSVIRAGYYPQTQYLN